MPWHGEDCLRWGGGAVRFDRTRGHGLSPRILDGHITISARADGDRLTAKLATFDAAWAALSPDERHQARAIHLDHDTRPDHVTVDFARQAPPRNP